ncbi:tRNA (adenosine(37)-N6)-threonylcarbamoyltransferase complex ATPase subunit type 1 TsaE [candidate division KSB1 bacterium]|nr:tRNA (adenosine(37)-N6)-threonylcarbamoyltransferase complex ATPase subunit type 1 TsaE [candidate division KSB1 bacterium]
MAKWLQNGDIVAFFGDLGSGKTYFIKGICEGLGIEDDVTSPTFTIMNVYEGPVDVYHFDFYRVSTAADVYGLGYEDYFYSDGICLIEWADRIDSFLPENRIDIFIDTPKDTSYDDRRDIKIIVRGLKIREAERGNLSRMMHNRSIGNVGD